MKSDLDLETFEYYLFTSYFPLSVYLGFKWLFTLNCMSLFFFELKVLQSLLAIC